MPCYGAQCNDMIMFNVCKAILYSTKEKEWKGNEMVELPVLWELQGVV